MTVVRRLFAILYRFFRYRLYELAGGILAMHLGIRPYSSAAGLASSRRGY